VNLGGLGWACLWAWVDLSVGLVGIELVQKFGSEVRFRSRVRKLRFRFKAKHDLRCAIASCELRCAVASCDVRMRTHFFETCDMRACGAFLGLRCAITTSHVFLEIVQDIKTKMSFLWSKLQFCTSKMEDFSN
jgi:hypothetical protein